MKIEISKNKIGTKIILIDNKRNAIFIRSEKDFEKIKKDIEKVLIKYDIH